MTNVTPYLFFSGNCREAMTFYGKCLGGEVFVQTIGESPAAAQVPPAVHHKVMHAAVALAGKAVLLASDWMSQDAFAPGNNISLCIDCGSTEEIETLFRALSEGGKVTQPLQEMFWGATYGQLIDRFGAVWMLNYTKPR